ncbi:IS3 family transposase [Brevibacillus sp. SYSU BS000544]
MSERFTGRLTKKAKLKGLSPVQYRTQTLQAA